MIRAATHEIPAQTVLSSQDFDKCILQKLPRITNKMTKIWDKKLLAILNKNVQYNSRIFFLNCFRRIQFYLS